MTELSDAEKRALCEVVSQAERDGGERVLIFRAGMLAGIERAVKVCEDHYILSNGEAQELCAAIRALAD